jgi:hypothetical protein
MDVTRSIKKNVLYWVMAQLQGGGRITCKVIIRDKVRAGHAIGGHTTCTAQSPLSGAGTSRPFPHPALRGHSGTPAQPSSVPRKPSELALPVMSTFLGIVVAVLSVLTLAGVAWLFIWAAKKDGEEDRAIQRRLGIRRRTRLGR